MADEAAVETAEELHTSSSTAPEKLLSTAEIIRRDVEQLMSEEGLAQHSSLVRMMHGRDNKPVTLQKLGFVAAWPKEVYSNTMITEALQDSKVVNLVEVNGKPCVQRKVPYDVDRPSASKSKNKTQPQSSGKPTGFEEYYADPPITPKEHTEEQELYDPNNSFAYRIETAIQRFQARRKFRPHHNNVFLKFLKFGGIDTGPRQFTGGLAQEDIEDMTATEIARAKATAFVDEEKFEEGPNSKWKVNFEGIARAFLSSIAPETFLFSSKEEVKQCTAILRGFYNYILYHQVCPEYTEDIFAARIVCDDAEDELPRTAKLISHLPGPFNISLSIFVSGFYKSMGASQEQNTEVPLELAPQKPVIHWKLAREILEAALLTQRGKGEDTGWLTGIFKEDDGQKADGGKARVEYENDNSAVGLEVVEVQLPMPASHSSGPKSSSRLLPEQGSLALGKLICRPWEMHCFTPLDLPQGTDPGASRPVRYEFLMEQNLLQVMQPGMKIEAVVGRIETDKDGVCDVHHYLDRVLNVRPSFYTVSDNELLFATHWREPQLVDADPSETTASSG